MKYSIFILSLITVQCYSQPITLQGTIYDEYNEVFLGASIYIFNNINIGTTTDLNGNYSLKCHIGDSVIIKFVGFQSFGFVVKDSIQNIYTIETYECCRCCECDLITYDMMPKFTTDYNAATHRKKIKSFINTGSAELNTQYFFTLSSPYSLKNKDIGVLLGTTYAFRGKACYGRNKLEEFINNNIHYVNLNITYVRPNWEEDALLYPQILIKKRLPIYFAQRHPLQIYGGVGYYWNIDDKFNFQKGNVVLSANLQFWRFSHKRIGLAFFGGYTWFIEQPQSNFLSIGVDIYPFSRKYK